MAETQAGTWMPAPDCRILHEFGADGWRPARWNTHEHWVPDAGWPKKPEIPANLAALAPQQRLWVGAVKNDEPFDMEITGHFLSEVATAAGKYLNECEGEGYAFTIPEFATWLLLEAGLRMGRAEGALQEARRQRGDLAD
jgi:hypothetical protein